MWFKATTFVANVHCPIFVTFFCILTSYNSRNRPPLFCDVLIGAAIFFEFAKTFFRYGYLAALQLKQIHLMFFFYLHHLLGSTSLIRTRLPQYCFNNTADPILFYFINIRSLTNFQSDDNRCCENTIGPPEDGHVNARNMSRIVM
jgi:hypothetical protein